MDCVQASENKVTELIRSTKQAYFKDKFSENKNSTRNRWNLIERLCNDDKGKQIRITDLTENAEQISNNETISEILKNSYLE